MMTQADRDLLLAAKQKIKQYHYGSLYHKNATLAYERVKQRLAQKYHCSVQAIEAEERK